MCEPVREHKHCGHCDQCWCRGHDERCGQYDFCKHRDRYGRRECSRAWQTSRTLQTSQALRTLLSLRTLRAVRDQSVIIANEIASIAKMKTL